jgi:catechol-2,3-dioxygenase
LLQAQIGDSKRKKALAIKTLRLNARRRMNDISPPNMNEPIFDVAQLAHVELLTPDLEGTLHFFKDLLGVQETERQAQSVYLRGYEEQYHHSLKVTAAACRVACPKPTGPGAAGRSHRGNGARARLDRWRRGTWSRLPV